MLRPNLILVGSDRGGVGKTTTARALVEYFEIMNIDVKAYDSQSPWAIYTVTTGIWWK